MLFKVIQWTPSQPDWISGVGFNFLSTSVVAFSSTIYPSRGTNNLPLLPRLPYPPWSLLGSTMNMYVLALLLIVGFSPTIVVFWTRRHHRRLPVCPPPPPRVLAFDCISIHMPQHSWLASSSAWVCRISLRDICIYSATSMSRVFVGAFCGIPEKQINGGPPPPLSLQY